MHVSFAEGSPQGFPPLFATSDISDRAKALAWREGAFQTTHRQTDPYPEDTRSLEPPITSHNCPLSNNPSIYPPGIYRQPASKGGKPPAATPPHYLPSCHRWSSFALNSSTAPIVRRCAEFPIYLSLLARSHFGNGGVAESSGSHLIS